MYVKLLHANLVMFRLHANVIYIFVYSNWTTDGSKLAAGRRNRVLRLCRGIWKETGY